MRRREVAVGTLDHRAVSLIGKEPTMSFWDVVWFIVITFAFAAYLMVMFSIITDLFRDPDASGIAKAAWSVALIFVPFLTAIVYMIARGNAMAERSLQHGQRLRGAQGAY